MQFDLAVNLKLSPIDTDKLEFSEFVWFHNRLYKHIKDNQSSLS